MNTRTYQTKICTICGDEEDSTVDGICNDCCDYSPDLAPECDWQDPGVEEPGSIFDSRD